MNNFRKSYQKVFVRVVRRFGMLRKYNYKFKSSEFDGVTIPIINGIGVSHLFDEEVWMKESLTRLVPNYCRDGRLFVDVGVNIGQTLLQVKSIDAQLPYVGFEPNPNCLYYLNELVKLNMLKDVTIYPFALSQKTGVVDLEFYSDDLTDTSASILSGFRAGGVHKIKVPVFNGEEFRKWTSGRLGILKIDVEGAELEVLGGLKEIIERDRPIIICEILPSYDGSNKERLTRQQQIDDIRKLLQYNIALINAEGGVEEKNSIDANATIDECNYLFIPEELNSEIVGLFRHAN